MRRPRDLCRPAADRVRDARLSVAYVESGQRAGVTFRSAESSPRFSAGWFLEPSCVSQEQQRWWSGARTGLNWLRTVVWQGSPGSAALSARPLEELWSGGVGREGGNVLRTASAELQSSHRYR